MRAVRPEYREPAAAVASPPPSTVQPTVTPFRPPAGGLRRVAAPRRPTDFETTLLEADRIFAVTSDDKTKWQGTEPRHFVALYWRLHTRVHGIEPGELRDVRTWSLACVEASCLLTREFASDCAAMAHYMAWVWVREHKSAGRGSAYRTGWRRQFSPALVTDYRVAMKQQQGRR